MKHLIPTNIYRNKLMTDKPADLSGALSRTSYNEQLGLQRRAPDSQPNDPSKYCPVLSIIRNSSEALSK